MHTLIIVIRTNSCQNQVTCKNVWNC